MNNSKPYVIGVSGGSGSGKTTFVKLLKEQFTDEEMCVFSMDDYYKPREEQELDENNEKNFDLPTSINRELYIAHLQELMQRHTVEKLEYTFNNHLHQPKVKTFHPAKIILLEGIFVFYYKEIYDLMDLKIYIDSKESNKVIRRIRRDREERNYPLEDVLYRYEKHVTPTYENFIRPYRSKVDLVVNNDKNFNEALKIITQSLKYRVSH